MTPSSHSGIQWFFPGVGPFSADPFLVSGVSKYRIPTTDDKKFNPENVRKTWAEKLHRIVPNRKGIFVFHFHNFSGWICSTSGRCFPSWTHQPPQRRNHPFEAMMFPNLSHLKWEIFGSDPRAPEGRVQLRIPQPTPQVSYRHLGSCSSHSRSTLGSWSGCQPDHLLHHESSPWSDPWHHEGMFPILESSESETFSCEILQYTATWDFNTLTYIPISNKGLNPNSFKSTGGGS